MVVESKSPGVSLPLHTGTRTPLRTLQPLAQKKTTEYMSLLEDDDSDLYGLQPLTQTFNPAQTRQECGEWESFTSHFTAQFEALKAEVDMLRNEVHRLKKAQKEAKVNSYTLKVVTTAD